ncbi:MAG TPA: hypothetical protein VK459_08815 [Polyangiaceae bacterium]|jgi:hypothetical protein|nr:hypothetical protein [Polyangiaceae bacterium]
MYSYAFDKSLGLIIGVLRTKPYFNEDEDYAILLDSIDRNRHFGKPGDPFKIILLIDAEVPIPNATWRRQFAKSRTKSFFPFLFVTVTPSHLLRGVLTMINWVSPPAESSATTAVETFEEAVAWIEQKTGKPLTNARRIYEEARNPMIRR